MIDAYEVGIQLLLHEDVSAGLAVINRDLAEVDQAIAATSAHLVQLTADAKTTAKAVASAVSTRPTPMPANYQQPEHTSVGVTPGATRDVRAAVPPVPGPEKTTAPTSKVAMSADQSDTSIDQQVGSRKEPAPLQREQSVVSSAPIGSAIEQTMSRRHQARAESSEPNAPLERISAPIATSAPQPSQVASLNDRTIPLAKTPNGRNEPRTFQVPTTAMVSRDQRSSSAGMRAERVQHLPTLTVAARRERSAAPWSGIEQPRTRGDNIYSNEQAVAPTSSKSSPSERIGGTVMLDGRLVGQWLSEHMGREASRPPSGTSFFDPRQTPAWNVSGVL